LGAHRLHVRRHPPALRKDVAGLEVDLSAIAPGYTVDVLIDFLRQLGYCNAMVELGGEVRAVGLRPDGQAWRIGVESPSTEVITGVVALTDRALTTAGDSRQVLDIGGVRYTHIVDPHSGAALPYRGESVTVLAETALEADALDTALVVMGSRAGYEWCVKHKVAALFQSHEPKTQRLVWRSTPRLLELLPKGVEAPQGTIAE
jgi:thiamine biosynthesis lipoprotein